MSFPYMTNLNRYGTCTFSAILRIAILPSLLFVLIFAPAAAPAQTTGPVEIDTAAVVAIDTLPTLKELKRNPRNALLWAAIPGGGQVYNKRWWKVPLVYSGLLGLVAYADFNQTSYRRYTTALENRCLGQADDCVVTEDEFPADLVSDSALLQARATADRARQTAYIGIFVGYLLQAVEAYTDAHLQEFDISDDLSVRLGPVVQPDGMMAAGLTIPLGSGRKLNREVGEVERLKSMAR
ncbi:hypothetical protein FUA23_03285 [Neolewinella aurantiaca]|uniref:DUF5683 domain-containing protein n=1 Tax=Neolewinella aurantiaca TaxID=2602767 RepID=A0A5C7FMG4_9BACT|nr:DUF5683 domain-containing protein [Neolewinella aurantiaca]TXF91260.1 hypothetical protein FUA23_03285 [Neolewinella aurantiaca]